MITLYTYDEYGNLIGSAEYDPDGTVPGRSTTVAPPKLPDGKFLVFRSGDWCIESDPAFPPLTHPAPDPVPQVVSRRQAKLALLQAGLLDDVDAAIASSGDRAAQIEWADAQEFRRDWTALVAMQPALGLTDEQIDNLFRLAATL